MRLLEWVGWLLPLPDAWKAEHLNGANLLYALGHALTRRERQAAHPSDEDDRDDTNTPMAMVRRKARKRGEKGPSSSKGRERS